MPSAPPSSARAGPARLAHPGDGASGGPGGAGGGGPILDPQAVAAAIQSELAQSEGTGVSAATERLLVAGTRLGRLTPAERAVVKQRLADLVDRLPDEVRHQLLRVVPNDDPRKCELLTEVLDDLPTQRLLDLVPRVDMKRGTHVSPFLTFLVRLCSVAAREASVSEAVEAQLGRFGLPTDLVHAGSDHVRAVLEQAFSQTAEHYTSIGELYQSSVNEFSISFEASADERSAAPRRRRRRTRERRRSTPRGSPSPWSAWIRATSRR